MLAASLPTAAAASGHLGLDVVAAPTFGFVFEISQPHPPPAPPVSPPPTWWEHWAWVWALSNAGHPMLARVLLPAVGGLLVAAYVSHLLWRSCPELAPMGVPPCPAREVHVQTHLGGDGRADEEDAFTSLSEEALRRHCAAPRLVADLSAVAHWLRGTAKGGAPPGGVAKPLRYKLPGDEPFVMVTYQQ
eukprot:3498902-Prymnesium_polylepis.1